MSEPILKSGGDAMLAPLDQIRTIHASLKADRDRLMDVIVTLRVNAMQEGPHDKLIDFIRNGLDGIAAGVTIGEAVIAWQQPKPEGEGK